MLWWTLRKTRSKDPETRKAAIAKLALAKDPRSVTTLAAALEDSSIDVKKAAIEALKEIGDPAAVDALRKLLEQDDAAIRLALVSALANVTNVMGISEAVCGLLYASRHRDEDTRVSAIAGLLEMGSRGVSSALIGLLGHKSSFVRREAVLRLQHHMNPMVIYHLTSALKDTEPAVRESVAEAIGNIAWAAREHQRHPISFQEAQEKRVLLEIRQNHVASALANLLNDENPRVRKAAQEALDKVKIG
jgi:HEAT repeat protein